MWARDKIEETLICLPQGEALCRNFQARLAELKVDWFPGFEASSTDLVETYVANGLGIGLSVAIPKNARPANVKVLELKGFPVVTIGALWRGPKTELIGRFLEEAQKMVRRVL